MRVSEAMRWAMQAHYETHREHDNCDGCDCLACVAYTLAEELRSAWDALDMIPRVEKKEGEQ